MSGGNSLVSLTLMGSLVLVSLLLGLLMLVLLDSFVVVSTVSSCARMLNGLVSFVLSLGGLLGGWVGFAPRPGGTCMNPSSSCTVVVFRLRFWGMVGASMIAPHPFLFGWMFLDLRRPSEERSARIRRPFVVIRLRMELWVRLFLSIVAVVVVAVVVVVVVVGGAGC